MAFETMALCQIQVTKINKNFKKIQIGPYLFQVADVNWWTFASCIVETGLG